jgi:proton-dependent oligopeptide transporter, POT family
MAGNKYLTAPIPSKKIPAGIPYILVNEAAERFAFYGMLFILVSFMTEHLKGPDGKPAFMGKEDAMIWFHLFKAAVYAIPLLGALLSDIWLGKYKTILIFSVVYCFGYLALALDQTRVGLVLGLSLIALGSGVIKPCVSANVGDQFGRTNQHLITKVYAWFYWSINLGAFISPLLIPILLDRYGPTVAFGFPGVMMLLATVAFWSGRKRYVHLPPGGIGFVKETLSGEGIGALRKLSVIFVMVTVFFALFDQTGSAWILQAKSMNRHWLGMNWHAEQITAVNALFIMILIPVFAYGVYPAINKVFGLSPLRKMSIGMFTMVVAFSISALIEGNISAGGTPAIGWQILAYFFLTAAEVMVSITYVEFSYTQAPMKMKSFIMCFYLLAIAFGNAIAAIVNIFNKNEDGTSKLEGASYYWFFTVVMLVTSVLFIFVAMAYREKTYIQDEGSVDEPKG